MQQIINKKKLDYMNLTQNNLSQDPRLFSKEDMQLFNNTANENLKVPSAVNYLVCD